mgnify:FL=1|tara:strand:- start:756 stop:1190 length:435 start_codon:yes stop_codon:yes gene_type:complete
MRDITYRVYKIDEHPDKDRCFAWVRDNMHDLAQHEVDDLINSLVKLRETIGGKLNYSLSQYACRGEHIRFTDYDKEALAELDEVSCPLTGVFCDHDVIECLRNNDMKGLIRRLHDWCEYHYTDEAIEEQSLANDWEFTIEGRLI